MDAPSDNTLPTARDTDFGKRLQRGDPDAWAAFVERYGAYIKHIARYQLSRGRRGPFDSDDFVQETFLRVLQKDRDLLYFLLGEHSIITRKPLQTLADRDQLRSLSTALFTTAATSRRLPGTT